MSTVAMELNRREKAAAAMVEMCSVRLGTALFGVPITHILEIVGSARPQPVPLAPPFVGGLVHYRGDVLTTVSLRQLLGLPAKEGSQDILVLESSGACWWIRWARFLRSPRPTMSLIRRSLTNAGGRCLTARTSSRTVCW